MTTYWLLGERKVDIDVDVDADVSNVVFESSPQQDVVFEQQVRRRRIADRFNLILDGFQSGKRRVSSKTLSQLVK